MTHEPISILESRWWSTGNHSVRALFEAVGAIHYGNPSAFYYDMFADRSSLSRMISMRASDKTTEVLYLATHGDETAIGPGAGVSISRTEFRNDFEAANKPGQIQGLYLGTCLTGNLNTAKFLLSANSKLEWLAGYRQSIDWVDGSAIDMVFFHKLAAEYKANNARRRGKLSSLQMAHKAASELAKLIPGAHALYGFNIYFRNGANVNCMYV